MYKKLEELNRLNNAMNKIVADVDRCNKQLESEYKQHEEMRLNEFMESMSELAGYAKNLRQYASCTFDDTDITYDCRTDIMFRKKRYSYNDCDSILIFKFKKDGSFNIETDISNNRRCFYSSEFSEYAEIKGKWSYMEYETFKYGWGFSYEKESKKFIAAHASEILDTVQNMIEDEFDKEIKSKANKAYKKQTHLIVDIERVKK